MLFRIKLLVLIIFLNACQGPDSVFIGQANRQVISKEIEIDLSAIGMPSRNLLYYDSCLVFVESKGNYLIKTIQLNQGNNILEFAKKGRGPEEIPFINSINKVPCTERTFFINEAVGRRISYFNIDSVINGVFTPDSSFLLMKERILDEVTPIRQYYLAENIVSDNYFLALYDKDFNLISESFEYPTELREVLYLLDPNFRTIALSARVLVSPDGKRFLSYITNTDFLEIINVRSRHLESIYRTYTYLKNIEVRSPNNYVYKNLRGGIIKGVCTDRYIYLLAHNHSNRLTQSEVFKGARHLYIFDWKGNLIDNLELDNDVLIFTVDDYDKYMYAFTYGKEETKLLQYDLQTN